MGSTGQGAALGTQPRPQLEEPGWEGRQELPFLVVASQLRDTKAWGHVWALPLPGCMACTALRLGVLIRKMGIEQLSCLRGGGAAAPS